MIHVDSDVPLVTDARPADTKPGMGLAEGDVIAVPFAGYADLLCEVTSIEPGQSDVITLNVSDGRMSYTHDVLALESYVVYPTSHKGQVRS